MEDLTNNVIPFRKETSKKKCSFCGIKEVNAKKFVANNNGEHCICGECIKHAKQRLLEETHESTY